MEGEKGGQKVKQMIAEVAGQSINSAFADIQKNTDSELEDIQKKNTAIVSSSIQSFNTANNEYYNEMNQFIKDEVNAHITESDKIITKMKEQQNTYIKSINSKDKETYTKEQVIACIRDITACDNSFIYGIKQELESSALCRGYEKDIPQLSLDTVPLPEVKKLYEEMKEDSTQEDGIQEDESGDPLEQDETDENAIWIDIDKEIDKSEKIEKAMESQEENIIGLITGIKESFVLPKTDIRNIIDEQIIGKIESENQNKMDSYGKVTEDLITSINEYDNKVTKFNPYDYIKKKR